MKLVKTQVRSGQGRRPAPAKLIWNIKGTLLDREGQGIRQAWVEAVDSRLWDILSEPLGGARTADDGTFEIEFGEDLFRSQGLEPVANIRFHAYRLVEGKREHIVSTVVYENVPPGRRKYIIEARPVESSAGPGPSHPPAPAVAPSRSMTIIGCVKDYAGSSLEGIRIRALDARTGDSITFDDTDGDGQFSLEVGAGSSVRVIYPRSHKLPDGRLLILQQDEQIECQPYGNLNLDDAIYGVRGCQISGQVVREVVLEDDSGWMPLAGVQVTLLDAQDNPVGHATTDGDGEFCLFAKATGLLKLSFEKDKRIGTETLTPATADKTVYVESGYPFDVAEPIKYSVARAEVVVQVDDGKRGLRGVPVTLIHIRTKQRITKHTDDAGYHRFKDILPGAIELAFQSPYIDDAGTVWELGPGSQSSQMLAVQAGEVKMAERVSYQREQHLIRRTFLSQPDRQPIAGLLVEVWVAPGTTVIMSQLTKPDGTVEFPLEKPGDYQLKFYPDPRTPRAPQSETVSVHSTDAKVVTLAVPFVVDAGSSSATNGGPGASSSGELKEAVVDSQAYPILTEAVSAPSAPGPAIGAPAPGASGPAPLSQTVEAALRDVLSWRPKSSDTKGFVTALNQAFTLKDVEGHVEWTWTPRSYAVTVADDLGAVTGAQASIYNRAKVALDQSLPLLDGLYPLTTEILQEDIDAMREIVRSEFTQLVTELGVVGGPRVQRVDELFGFLLGLKPVADPESVEGHLKILGSRLGLERDNVNTVDDEQNLTNYLIIVDYVNGLKQSWDSQRKYFDRLGKAEPFLGTQLVLVSQALTAAAEAVQQVYFTMDSVFLGPAERQTLLLDFSGTITVPEVPGDDDPGQKGKTFTFGDGDAPLYVSELLDWVYRVVAEEAPRLVQDSGKDGVIAFFPVVNKLRKLVQGAKVRGAGGVQDLARQALPAGYGTPRVQRALDELADGLDDVTILAGQIYVPEKQPRAQLEAQVVLDALQDPEVVQAIQKAIAAQKSNGTTPRNGARGK